MDNRESDTPQFTIVGAGLAGALMACYLGKAGHRVDLFEKRHDPRGHDPERGRSINLAISVRGIQALKEVGLADEVLAQAIPMRGRMMHPRSGRLAFQPYGKDDSESINSVSRAGLNLALIQEADRSGRVRVFFQRRCTGIDLHTGAVELLDEAAGAATHIPADIVIGADGAYSAVRAQMQKQERFNYQQDYLPYAYKELSIPAGPGGGFALEKHALHIWPRHSFMMIALPNLDGSFTCTLFLPYEGARSFAGLSGEAEVRHFFAEHFPDAVPLMPTLVEDFFHNPTGPLLTVRCGPWHVNGRVVLLGDACHAVVPFLGQGMNAAFEDCSVLSQCLNLHGTGHVEAAFRDYEGRRKPNVDTLADLCIDNFIEMRDRVSSRVFLWRKRFQILLHKLLPRWYLPLYTLVTFTRTPYAEALRRARKQDRIVRLILTGILLLVLAGLFWKWATLWN
jgi:kynurenine 3-monooxygenase